LQLLPVTYGPRGLAVLPARGDTARATAPVLATQAAGGQGHATREPVAWVEILSRARDEAHGHGPFVTQRLAQEDGSNDVHPRHQHGTAAYLKTRDSRVQLLLSDKIVDLKV